MPVQTLGLEGGGFGGVPYQLEKGTNAGSHINWRKERMLVRTLDLEGGWIVMSHIDWIGEQNTLCKGVETSP